MGVGGAHVPNCHGTCENIVVGTEHKYSRSIYLETMDANEMTKTRYRTWRHLGAAGVMAAQAPVRGFQNQRKNEKPDIEALTACRLCCRIKHPHAPGPWPPAVSL